MMKAFVLERSLILSRLGGDEEIFTMMADLFLQDVEGIASAFASAFSQGSSANVMREAHTIKGLLATFSDEDGAAAAFTLEQQAKQGHIDGLQPAVTALQQRLIEVADVLRREMGRAG
ncbi:MAG: Hpt domain-containing protein [Azonexus sp.]|nr:Hpt domain-containing protein [Burkholderiaceae bacterium]MDP3637570.1 Hpt domain-containing protein [Azonexus sp.]MDZ4314925.1 Hpt domain-containing protein [Azonexus sp.]